MTDPIPSGLACRRLAIAMAAGSGLRFDHMDGDQRAAFDKHANSALLYLGMRGEIAADHLAERLDLIVKLLRISAETLESGPHTQDRENAKLAWLAASDAETVSAILRGLPVAEPEETVLGACVEDRAGEFFWGLERNAEIIARAGGELLTPRSEFGEQKLIRREHGRPINEAARRQPVEKLGRHSVEVLDASPLETGKHRGDEIVVGHL